MSNPVRPNFRVNRTPPYPHRPHPHPETGLYDPIDDIDPTPAPLQQWQDRLTADQMADLILLNHLALPPTQLTALKQLPPKHPTTNIPNSLL